MSKCMCVCLLIYTSVCVHVCMCIEPCVANLLYIYFTHIYICMLYEKAFIALDLIKKNYIYT